MAVRKRKSKVKVEDLLQEHTKKLSYILNEVSANGNPGLDASLKDLYRGNKEIKAKLDEIHELIKPDIDRANLWKAIRAVVKTNGFIKFCKTKFGAVVVGIGVILLANAILYPFIGTSITVATLIALVKKIAEAL